MSPNDSGSHPSQDPLEDVPSEPALPAQEPAQPPSPEKKRALEAIFTNPVLTRIILAILRAKGIPEQEREDLKQDVLTSLYTWCLKDSGRDTHDEIARMGRDITTKLTKNWWRDRAVDRKHNAGPSGEPDELPPLPAPTRVDLLDLKKIVAEIGVLLATKKLSEREAAVMLALADDETFAAHANETQQKAPTVRKMHERSRDKIVEHLHARGLTDIGLVTLLKAGSLAAAVAILFLLVYRGHFAGIPDQPVAKNPPHVEGPTPPIEDVVKALAPPVDHTDEVARAVIEAEVDYKNNDWDDCIKATQQAARLDPNGDVLDVGSGCAREKSYDMDAKTPRKPRKRK